MHSSINKGYRYYLHHHPFTTTTIYYCYYCYHLVTSIEHEILVRNRTFNQYDELPIDLVMRVYEAVPC